MTTAMRAGLGIGCLVAGVYATTMLAPAKAEEAPTWTQAQLAPDSSKLGFAMAKWMDPKGDKKTVVKGSFVIYKVELNKPVQQLRTMADLTTLKGRVSVSLGTVETDNPARNMNVANTYFEVHDFPRATVTFDRFYTLAKPAGVTPEASGLDVFADGSIDLHGVTHDLKRMRLHVTKGPDSITVATAEPIHIKSEDFGLPAKALLAVCKHAGLDEAAEVTASFTLLP